LPQGVNSTRKNVAGIATFQQQYIHVGPLPSPEQLRIYEQVLPGAADRIVKMAEAQISHRHSIERRASRAGSRDSLAGILSALVMCMAALGVSAMLILRGFSAAGTIITGTSLAALAGAFIYGTNANKRRPPSE
jgi:uncharacterized membrane protein